MTTGGGPPAVRLQGVTKKFSTGTLALEDVTLDVAGGEFVAIVGPSGCGKSTLLRVVAGLVEPTTGSVSSTCGSPGFVFQEPTLLPWRTIAQNVGFSLELRGVSRPDREERVRACLTSVKLDGFEQSLPRQLSGGMQMRASLARALAASPEMILLDEPLGALDEITRLHLQAELQAIYSEKRFTCLLVTHSVDEAVFLASRVVVMSPRPGRIHQVIDVPYSYPRPRQLRFEPAFNILSRDVSRLLEVASDADLR